MQAIEHEDREAMRRNIIAARIAQADAAGFTAAMEQIHG